MNRKKLIFTSLLVAVSLYLLLTAFTKDITVNQYKDRATVLEQHAIENGWVPGNLPASAYDIKEVHGKDSRGIFGKFRYKEPDEAKWIAQLKPYKESNQTLMWGAFLFRVDTEKNIVKYRNNPRAVR